MAHLGDSRPNSLDVGEWSDHRNIEGVLPGVDAALSGTFPNRRALLNTSGFETIICYPNFTGGGSVTLTPLLYDDDLDVPPAGTAFATHVATGVLATGDAVEVATFGMRVFLLITATAGVVTDLRIRVTPGNRSEGVALD